MKRFKAHLCLLCSLALMTAPASMSGQNAIQVSQPQGGLGWLTRPYRPRVIAPINLTNTNRLEALVRGGNLYLSSPDVIALALENNLDIEIQRYGPVLYRQVSLRTQGGGLLRSVGVGNAQGPQSVSLTGVSLNASGSNGATAAASSGGVLTSLGPSPVNLDPQFSVYANFGHFTTPESNTFLVGTNALTTDNRTFQAVISKYNDFGTYAKLTFAASYNKFNSLGFNLNPFTQGDVDLQISQNLLQGFGRATIGRFIRVAKNNEAYSDLQFRQQVITTVSAVLNLYWDLVSFNEDVKARKDELNTAQALFDDNKKQVEIGTLAPIEVTRAESQVYSSQQDLLIAETNLLQQEIVLKNALSRNGVASPLLAETHVIPLDTVQVPQNDEMKPLEELVSDSMKRRVEIQQDRINLDSDRISLHGIKNGLKPTLSVFTELTNNGLAGSANYLGPNQVAAIPYLTGGTANLLGQIFKRDFPSYSAGLQLNIPLRNRAAQSDYVTTALSMRQDELALQKATNQVRVDVQSAVIGLRQARVRYESSVKARILQQQTLDADKKKYTLGASTVFQVVQDQQTLASAQSAEQQALANYSHARISFDLAMGTTLDVNHISVDEALSGHVKRQSELPVNLPAVTTTSPLLEPKQ